MALILNPFFITVGLYSITIGLWELRAGADRTAFVTFTFTGLVLVFVVTRLFGILEWY
jgi:hypothetical protein